MLESNFLQGWSSCPCQSRGFDAHGVFSSGCSSSSHRLQCSILDARRDSLFSCRSVVLEELHHQAQNYILGENKSVVGDSPIR